MVKNTKGGSSHKKLARKKEDDAKEIVVDLNINFKEMIIVLVDKNIGTCFTCKYMHGEDEKKEFQGKELKVLHQRGRGAKKSFNQTQSKLALVSLSDLRLQSGCIGVVEEFLQIDHLNAYLNNKKISKEVYSKLEQSMTIKVDNIEDEQGGFDFDRSGTIQETVETKTNKTNETKINKKTVEENDSGSSSDVDINDI